MQNSTVTAQDLRTYGRDLPFPFRIDIPDAAPLICESPLRILPGKRLTVLAKWGDKPVVAKIFIHEKEAKRHFERDVNGVLCLMQHKIATPNLLYCDKTHLKNAHVLLLEYLAPAKNLHELWKETEENQLELSILNKLMQKLASMHACGILQTDLHLRNFLLYRHKVYCLDGDGITQTLDAQPINLKKSLENLALLFAQLQRKKDFDMKQAFAYYATFRNWSIDETLMRALQEKVEKTRTRLHQQFLRKTQRDCTSFYCRQTPKSFIVVDREFKEAHPTLDFAKMENLFQANHSLLKNGRSSTVIDTAADGAALVVKRYNIKNFLHACKRALKRTRARRSWINAHYLKELGIKSVKPIALYEKKCLGLNSVSYFVAEKIEGQTLLEYLAQNPSQKDSVAKNIASLLKKLFEAKISHGDLKASNFIVHAQDIYLIDLDSLKKHHFDFSFNRARQKDINRFLQNFSKKDANDFREYFAKEQWV